jgi:ABC-2 type transport system ATP-binding protein
VTFAIQVEGYTKVYSTFAAVSDLSFAVPPGEIHGLCGPNGAGKTTTLRALAGIIAPTHGKIRICGHDVREDPLAAKRELAFVPDEPALFEHLTAWEHLQLTARLYGVQDPEPKAHELFQEMELLAKKDELPAALSRGMKQKLSLACAFLHSPRAILLDEPLTGLDPLGIRRIKDSIVRRAREGAAVILSSHLLSLVEEMCHKVLILNRGRKVFHGSRSEIAAAYPDLAAQSLEAVFLKLTEPAERDAPR